MNDDTRYPMTSDEGWSPERWSAILVLAALGALIALRMGFRGVSFLGARASI